MSHAKNTMQISSQPLIKLLATHLTYSPLEILHSLMVEIRDLASVRSSMQLIISRLTPPNYDMQVYASVIMIINIASNVIK